MNHHLVCTLSSALLVGIYAYLHVEQEAEHHHPLGRDARRSSADKAPVACENQEPIHKDVPHVGERRDVHAGLDNALRLCVVMKRRHFYFT